MNKKILITAGSTKVPIDRVRAIEKCFCSNTEHITNIFNGKTGTYIAKHFCECNFDVTLLTSNPAIAEVIKDRVRVVKYKTFDELHELMKFEITNGGYDVVIHSSAVSDYKCSGVYFLEEEKLVSIESDKKVSSKHKELFLKLVPTEKLVDKIRDEWGFKGTLVKFKLEVGKSDEELIEIARKSRKFSHANLIVANCLEWSHLYAYVVDEDDYAIKISRRKLPEALVVAIKKGETK